jgi:tRNA A-37 threonylcarbamoyl transferase component Bud32
LSPEGGNDQSGANSNFFFEVLNEIHKLMDVAFGLHSVSVMPIGSEGARLSIPVKIEGLDTENRKMIYFGKILGNSDNMTLRAYQFFKNIFLHASSKEALFDFTVTAKGMAKHQYDGLSKMYELGIPTARPYGYYPLTGGMWFFVAEFLDMEPGYGKVTMEQMDRAFQLLRKMHRLKLFHGDIKPDNLIFADDVYIMDLGHFLDDAPDRKKRVYDLACMAASFLELFPAKAIVEVARKYYSARDMRKAAEYLELIDRRPDFHMSVTKKEKLMHLMQE